VGLLGTFFNLKNPSGSWGPVLVSLYYIPIVIAARILGTLAALVVALGAGVAHALVAFGSGQSWMEPIAQTVLFVCVGLIAAGLAQRRAETVRMIRHDGEAEAFLASARGTNSDEANNDNEMRALSRVAGALVARFRTPVTSIEGAGWVLDDPHLPDDKRRELVGIVRKEAHRLSRALTDVIEFTQPRPPTFQVINLSTLVDNVIQTTNPKDYRHSYILSKKIPQTLPELRGDSEQITQVLRNLVVNSIQATPNGGEIEISARVADEKFIITVKDQGRGIPPAAVDKVFDPFFTTYEHSLGLGLPMAQRIVSQHGGQIKVDCQQRDGTCISVILPKSPRKNVK
jgi:signal transduction histidine kinase